MAVNVRSITRIRDDAGPINPRRVGFCAISGRGKGLSGPRLKFGNRPAATLARERRIVGREERRSADFEPRRGPATAVPRRCN
jgi:hypothetical protein